MPKYRNFLTQFSFTIQTTQKMEPETFIKSLAPACNYEIKKKVSYLGKNKFACQVQQKMIYVQNDQVGR